MNEVATQPIERSKPGRVTGRLRTAIHAMVWQGLQRKEAAQAAGLAEHSLYQAFRRPPVKAYYLAELDVLRTSLRARNIHILSEVSEQRDNQMARVNAVKALEQLSDDPTTRSTGMSLPGLVIQIINQSPDQPKTINNNNTDEA